MRRIENSYDDMIKRRLGGSDLAQGSEEVEGHHDTILAVARPLLLIEILPRLGHSLFYES